MQKNHRSDVDVSCLLGCLQYTNAALALSRVSINGSYVAPDLSDLRKPHSYECEPDLEVEEDFAAGTA
ncbi:uncharacterized protein LOC143899680 isoform X11 [Temnothorax americanus]|uniref:uncharacterized protein LOC143899680 isoform X11 n=1 Tax=Temnothorax americanus TaxID=1964332 RepID=UPI0040694935